MSWIGFFLAAAFAVQPPKIEKLEGFFFLNISADVQRTLKAIDPYFTTWNDFDFIPSIRQDYKASQFQTMGAVIGDFNGDRKQDAAIMGRGREHNLLVVLISKDGGYEAIEVDRSPAINPGQSWIEGPKGREKGLWRFLTAVKPGYLSSKFEKKPIQLKNDAFQDNYFAGGSVVYYFKDGSLQKYTLGD